MMTPPAKGHNAIYLNGVSLAGRWWPTEKKYLDSLSPLINWKSCQSWSRLTPLLDARMEEVPTTYLEDGLYAIWSVFKQWSQTFLHVWKGNTFLAFIYIPTPGSDIMKFQLSTIESEEGWDESVHMWNLDRAFSPNGRRWKLRILAPRQTKYCRWFIPKMNMVIYYKQLWL